jgi:DNA invertase Pin-like site-specific DNA recombinase
LQRVKGYTIIGEYIDRAKSAKTANRPEFLRMISDSSKHLFQHILVYKLDRFSRNRYDSAFYKAKLRQNGVQVVSATECLTDSPESIITEAMLEAMAEFYSAELGQKTKRGMRESALKCQTVGAQPPLGYKWGEDKKLHIDEATAQIPRIAFRMYADGKGKKEIADYLNAHGYRTRTGRKFQLSTFGAMFTNPKYIGIYTYEDISIEGGVPALIDRETWDKVQALVERTKRAPARARAKVEYYLSGKLFYGVCGEQMIAVGGTSTNGEQHHYYKCKSHKLECGKCGKRSERKSFIEWFVTDSVLDLLNMEANKEKLADKIIAAYTASMGVDRTAEIEKKIEAVKRKQSSIVDMLLEHKTQALLDKLDNLELQKSELEEELYSAKLAGAHIPTRSEIVQWFERLRAADGTSDTLMRQVLNTFVQKVYLWDDKVLIVLSLYNTSETVEFEDIREWEKLAEENPEITYEPLPDSNGNGSFMNMNGSPTLNKSETSVTTFSGRGTVSGSSLQLKLTTILSS